MTPGIDELAALPVPILRQALAPWVASHVVDTPEALARLTAELSAVVDQTSDEALAGLLRDFAAAGDEYRLYPANPVARVVTRVFMSALLQVRELVGLDRLDAFLAGGPARRMIVANHLSYADTQITDTVLSLEGRAPLADRLVAIAGPKVYTDAWRRIAAIGLNTRKTAQSSAVATEQGALGPRELAAVAFETLRDCERLMDEGWIILLYPEGTRSRTGRLQPFLRAAGRYLQIPGLRVLPMAQTGSNAVFPIGDPLMYPRPVRLAFGDVFDAAAFPGRHAALAEAHRRVAGQLPEGSRPEEGAAAIA